jgi:type II secretory pathway pseudopilin PulG
MLNNERGFTLVEAVVAMMVCTVGLVAMAELMAVTLRLQQLGRNSTSAARLAQDKVDELTTMSFTANASIACGGSIDADVANYNDTPMEDNGTPDDTADDILAKGYTRRWVVSAGPDGDPNLRQVTVRVIPDVNDRRTSAPFDLTTFIRNGDQIAPPPVCP